MYVTFVIFFFAAPLAAAHIAVSCGKQQGALFLGASTAVVVIAQANIHVRSRGDEEKVIESDVHLADIFSHQMGCHGR
jgi:hypothetical protein